MQRSYNAIVTESVDGFGGFDDGVIYDNSVKMLNSIKVSSKEELSWLM